MDRDVIDKVDAALAKDCVFALDLPHIVHVYDHVLGVATAVGPFHDPVTASAFAERYLAEAVQQGDDRATLRVDVLPLEIADHGGRRHL